MIVALETGTSARTCGRAAAMPSRARAASTSPIGTCLRQRRTGPAATRTSATLECRTA